MVRRRSDPRALQGNCLARVMHDRDAHQILIPDHAARRVEVYPARAGDIDLDPGMGIRPVTQLSSSSPRCRYPDTKRAANPSERRAEIMNTARSRNSRWRSPGSAPVLERPSCAGEHARGLLQGPRHVDQKLVGVGRSVLLEECCGPTIDLGMRIQRGQETGEIGRLFLGVGKWIGPGAALDVGGAEGRRHMVETNGALEIKLGSGLRETGGLDMIPPKISGVQEIWLGAGVIAISDSSTF